MTDPAQQIEAASPGEQREPRRVAVIAHMPVRITLATAIAEALAAAIVRAPKEQTDD